MRPIDADALRKEVTEKVHFMTVDGHLAYDKMLKLIDSAPPVELADRPKGEWVFKKFDEETGIANSDWCPFCGMVKAQVYDNFCSYCGADMRKGDAE